MNILAIGCHPDDVESHCAGTLAKYVSLGHKATICTVANGNMGHMEIMPDELREIRRQEAINAGKVIGAEVLTCDIGDLDVYEGSKRQRDLVVDILRTVKPDVIITHSPDDYMPDHVAVSRLVFDAAFAASVPHYATAVPGTAPVTPIFYMEHKDGVNFYPTEYVDITETLEKKIEMVNCHVSQLKWLRDHDNIDFPEIVTSIARFRGLQCGVKYAEVYTQCQVSLRMSPVRLLP